MLDENEGGGDESTLSDVVDRIIGHWLNQRDGLLGPSASASNTESHGSAVSERNIK